MRRRGRRGSGRALRRSLPRHPRHVVLFAVVAGLLLGAVAARRRAAARWPRRCPARRWLAAAPAPSLPARRRRRAAGAGAGALARRRAGASTARRLLEPVRDRARSLARARLSALERAGVLRRVARATRGPAVARRPAGSAGRAAARRAVAARARARLRSGAAGRRRRRSCAVRGRDRAARRATTPTSAGAARTRRSTVVAVRRDGRAARRARRRARRRAAARRGAALERGLRAAEAALLRGMVLGQDERLAEAVRDGLPALRARAPAGGQRPERHAARDCSCSASGAVARARRCARGWPLALAARRALRPAGRRRAVDPARGGDGRRRARRRARRAARRRAGTRSGSPPRSRSRSTRARPGEPGWQLSFAAVVGLLALAPPLRRGAARARGLPGPVADAPAVTPAATLATAPLLALHFEQVSLASLPANLARRARGGAGDVAGDARRSALAQVAPALARAAQRRSTAPLLAYLEWVAHVAAAPPAAPAGAARRRRRRWPRPTSPALAARVALAGRARRRARHGARRARSAPRRGARRAPRSLARSRSSSWPHAPAPAAAAAPGRARRLVPRRRPGRRDAAPARRRVAARRHRAARRADPARLEAGRRRAARRARAHPRAGRPRGRGARGPRARSARGSCSTAAPAGRRPCSAGCAAGRAARRPSPRRAGRAVAAPRRRARARPVAAAAAGRAGGRTATRTSARSSRTCAAGAFDLLLPADAESDVTAALELPDVEALKVAHHGSADAGLPALLERLRPRVRGDRGRQPATPTAIRRRRRSRALRAVPNVVRTDRDGTVRLRVSGAVRARGAGWAMRLPCVQAL